MKKLLTVLLLFFSLYSLSSCRQDTLIVYTEAGFAPFEYVKDGKIVGVDVDIMNEVGKRINKKVVFENVSFDTIIDAVKDGKLTNVGSAGLSITNERLEKVDFSKVYYKANLYVIYQANIEKNIIHTMSDGNSGVYWESLTTNKGIGVQTGTTADLFLSDEIKDGGLLQGIKKTDFDSLDTAIADLGKNIDYLIIDELPAKTLCQNYQNISTLPLYYSGLTDTPTTDEYAICVTKGKSELLSTINEVIDELLIVDENGQSGIDKLISNHLGISLDEKKDSNLFKDIYIILTTKAYRNYLLEGFLNTLIVTIIAAIIGLIIGFIVAIIKILSVDNKYLKIPNIICNLYTTIIRGTPVALQLFIMVFALLAIPGFKVTAVILTFGINSGAYVSESIRAGILSVDKGQMEAGRALGLSKLTTMIKIIIPQAVKNVIPAIGNELIALVKETAIVSMVGSTVGTLTFDLNQATSTINKSIANYLAPAILAAILYLIIVYGITLLIKLIERKFSVSDKY